MKSLSLKKGSVVVVVIFVGNEFHKNAPEKDKLALKMSILGFGKTSRCFDIELVKTDFVNSVDKYTGSLSFNVLYMKIPLLKRKCSDNGKICNCFIF